MTQSRRRGVWLVAACLLEAPTASADFVDRLNGPVTASEIQSTAAWFRANPYTPSGTNQGNNLAYGNGAKQAGQMRALYDLTGDMLLPRPGDPLRGPHPRPCATIRQTGRVLWTGRREPCLAQQGRAGAGDAGVLRRRERAGHRQHGLRRPSSSSRTRASGTGRSASAIPTATATTYLAAGAHVPREGNRTATTSSCCPYYVQPDKINRLHIPTHPGCGGPARQLRQGPGPRRALEPAGHGDGARLSVIADMPARSSTRTPARVARYDAIARAALDWFRSELEANKYQRTASPSTSGATPGRRPGPRGPRPRQRRHQHALQRLQARPLRHPARGAGPDGQHLPRGDPSPTAATPARSTAGGTPRQRQRLLDELRGVPLRDLRLASSGPRSSRPPETTAPVRSPS